MRTEDTEIFFVKFCNERGAIIKEKGFPTLREVKQFIKDEIIDYVESGDQIIMWILWEIKL